MKAEELKTKTPDELQKLLLDTKKDQFNLRFQRSQGTLENTAQVRKNRRLIARIKTLLGAPAAAEAAKGKTANDSAAAKPKKAASASAKATADKPKKAAAKKKDEKKD